LESDYVDRNISLWIDQVFGYKQKGEDAKRPNTLSTNADQVKPILFNMQYDKISSDTKLLQTGQAPTQLFKKLHTKRMNISEANESSYKVYKPKEAKLGLKIVYIQGCSYDGSRYLTFKINPSLYGEANISQSMQKAKPISDKINIYKIDTEAEQELAGAFGIRSIPSILFCPKEGQPQMAAGALPKDSFKQAIDEILLGVKA
jgi:hypothetical protein